MCPKFYGMKTSRAFKHLEFPSESSHLKQILSIAKKI